MTMLELWHADSLAGPMKEMKGLFEARSGGVAVNLTSGRSKELAERLLQGEACDLFVPSDPQVIEALFDRKIGVADAASWYLVFSANELVVITGKGNPLEIRRMSDLARPGVRLARVAGEKDMATARTLEFIKRATTAEGNPELAPGIVAGAIRENTIPDVLEAVRSGRADAGIVYLSAAVTVSDAAEVLSFPAAINLSESIRNAVTIPATARHAKEAEGFVALLLSAEGRQILQRTGQPPIVPPLRAGRVPFPVPES